MFKFIEWASSISVAAGRATLEALNTLCARTESGLRALTEPAAMGIDITVQFPEKRSLGSLYTAEVQFPHPRKWVGEALARLSFPFPTNGCWVWRSVLSVGKLLPKLIASN